MNHRQAPDSRNRNRLLLLFAAVAVIAGIGLVLLPFPEPGQAFKKSGSLSSTPGARPQTPITQLPTTVSASNPAGRAQPVVTSDSSATARSLDDSLKTYYVRALQEIAAQISDTRYSEGQNELDALVEMLEPLTDNEKLALLDDFLAYSANNVFNPEVITAFDSLWNQLSLEEANRILSTKRLASHYANSYEFALALQQFSILASAGVPIEAALLRDLSYAHFSMGEYSQAIPALEEHITLQTAQGKPVARREYAMLFESYYRLGDFEGAELIGSLILAHYNDIQDWKDMQQFYQSTGNGPGLAMHMARARELGLVNAQGNWQN